MTAEQDRKRRWQETHKEQRLAKVHCDVCGADVSRSHLKRHRESIPHLRAVAQQSENWALLPSDEVLTHFLHTVDGKTLRGYERRLFQFYRSPEASS